MRFWIIILAIFCGAVCTPARADDAADWRDFLLHLPDGEYDMMMRAPNDVNADGRIRIAPPFVAVTVTAPNSAVISINPTGATLVNGAQMTPISPLPTGVPNFLYDRGALDAENANFSVTDSAAIARKNNITANNPHIKIIRYSASGENKTRYDYEIYVDDFPMGTRRLMGWKTSEWLDGEAEPAVTEYRLFGKSNDLTSSKPMP